MRNHSIIERLGRELNDFKKRAASYEAASKLSYGVLDPGLYIVNFILMGLLMGWGVFNEVFFYLFQNYIPISIVMHYSDQFIAGLMVVYFVLMTLSIHFFFRMLKKVTQRLQR